MAGFLTCNNVTTPQQLRKIPGKCGLQLAEDLVGSYRLTCLKLRVQILLFNASGLNLPISSGISPINGHYEFVIRTIDSDYIVFPHLTSCESLVI